MQVGRSDDLRHTDGDVDDRRYPVNVDRLRQSAVQSRLPAAVRIPRAFDVVVATTSTST
jgi:hypothetical protein